MKRKLIVQVSTPVGEEVSSAEVELFFPPMLSARELDILKGMREHYFSRARQAEAHIGEKPIWKTQFDRDMERALLLDHLLFSLDTE